MAPGVPKMENEVERDGELAAVGTDMIEEDDLVEVRNVSYRGLSRVPTRTGRGERQVADGEGWERRART